MTNPRGQTIGGQRGGVVVNLLQVEDDDVRRQSFLNAPAILQAESRGVRAGHLVNRLLERDRLFITHGLQKPGKSTECRWVLRAHRLHPGIGHEMRGRVPHQGANDLRRAVFEHQHPRLAAAGRRQTDKGAERRLSHPPGDGLDGLTVVACKFGMHRVGDDDVAKVDPQDGFHTRHLGLQPEQQAPVAVGPRHPGQKPFRHQDVNQRGPAVMEKSVELQIDSLTAGPVEKGQGLRGRPPGAGTEKNKVRKLQTHPGLARQVQHVPDSLQVVGHAEGLQAIGGRKGRERPRMHREDLVVPAHQTGHGLEFFRRREYAGLVLQPQGDAGGPLFQGRFQILVHQTLLVAVERAGFEVPDGRAHRAVSGQEQQVVGQSVLRQHIEIVIHRMPAQFEAGGLVHQIADPSQMGAGRIEAGRTETAVARHECGDSLVQERSRGSGMLRGGHEPVVVRMHVDESRSHDAAAAVDHLGAFRHRQTETDIRNPSLTHQDIAL